ncbi:MAG: hypothetical protein CME70_07185 [Halobacteriovorax sp.]|nr:hypothetical protein [Halobacteriovorax sp.]|tara:strand:+ start:403328 stop:404707 length:1380 start_codon:yes stop_codon:yes gene_type:complete
MINLKNFVEKNNDESLGKVRSVKRVSTDTRTIQEGDLFLALSGENFDGNKFINAAIDKGASGCVYRKSDGFDSSELYTKYPEVFFIGVDNTEKYLQDLAKYHQKSWREKVKNSVTIGITGSNGKTTTKELLAAISESIFPNEVLYTKGNLNNHLGVPMTMLRLEDTHRICILEMGTNHPGEISFLCNLGDPNAGIITTVGQSHLEFFNTEENVFKEKRALFDFVNKKKGCFSYDGDNRHLKALPVDNITASVGFEFGNTKAELSGRNIKLKGKVDLNLNAPYLFGIHNFKNLALSAALLAQLFPEKISEIESSCLELKLPNNNRSELIERDGKTIFLDAYNANPSSMIASLETFVTFLKENSKELSKSMFILGDMNELGSKSPEYHEEIGKLLKTMNIDNVIFIGRFSEFYNKGYSASGKCYASVDEFSHDWTNCYKQYSNFFLKGSRTLQLETLVALN